MENFSASKVVFMVMGFTACGAFLMGLLEAKDFLLLAGMAYAFYYQSNNGTPIGGVK